MKQRLGKTVAQIILRWHLQKWPQNYAVIPRSTNPANVTANIQIFDF